MAPSTEWGAGLDTSVVVRLLTGQPAPQAAAAKEFLWSMEMEGSPVFVSNLVVAEAYFACHHHYGISKGEVLAALHELLAQPTFQVQAELLNILSLPGLDTGKPGFLDRLIHSEYSQAGLPLVSFEKAALRFSDGIVLG